MLKNRCRCIYLPMTFKYNWDSVRWYMITNVSMTYYFIRICNLSMFKLYLKMWTVVHERSCSIKILVFIDRLSCLFNYYKYYYTVIIITITINIITTIVIIIIIFVILLLLLILIFFTIFILWDMWTYSARRESFW